MSSSAPPENGDTPKASGRLIPHDKPWNLGAFPKYCDKPKKKSNKSYAWSKSLGISIYHHLPGFDSFRWSPSWAEFPIERASFTVASGSTNPDTQTQNYIRKADNNST